MMITKRMYLLVVFCTAMLFGVAQENKHCDAAKEKEAAKKHPVTNSNGNFGATFKTETAVDVKSLPKSMEGKKEGTFVIKGTVTDVCKVKGCWMEADLGNGKSMRITFKDYGFFVPKDCQGKTFYAQGTAGWDTTSVAMLKHYAGDAGKSQKEIDAIKNPEVELGFVADGVLIEDKKGTK
jgi:hypothetical protein